jgi:hypothetical protein
MTIEEQIQQIEAESNPGANTKGRIGAALRAIAGLFKNFANFTPRNAPSTGDYVVGYNANDNTEIRIPVANLNLAMSYYTRLVKSEVIAGECNDANTTFVLKDEFKPGSTVLYFNGVRQLLNEDYSEDSVSKSITVVIPPKPLTKIYVELELK